MTCSSGTLYSTHCQRGAGDQSMRRRVIGRREPPPELACPNGLPRNSPLISSPLTVSSPIRSALVCLKLNVSPAMVPSIGPEGRRRLSPDFPQVLSPFDPAATVLTRARDPRWFARFPSHPPSPASAVSNRTYTTATHGQSEHEYQDDGGLVHAEWVSHVGASVQRGGVMVLRLGGQVSWLEESEGQPCH